MPDFGYPSSIRCFTPPAAVFWVYYQNAEQQQRQHPYLIPVLAVSWSPSAFPSLSTHWCQIHFLQHSPALVRPLLKNLQLFSITSWIEPRIFCEWEGRLCFSLYGTDSAWGGRKHCSWGEQGQGWEVSGGLLFGTSLGPPGLLRLVSDPCVLLFPLPRMAFFSILL